MSPRPTRSRRSAAATIWARAAASSGGRSSNWSRHWPKRSRLRPRARISAIAAAEMAPLSWLTSPCSTRASRRPLRARAAVVIRSSSARRSNMRTSTERSSSRARDKRSTRARLPSSFAAARPLGKAARISSAMSPSRQWSMAVISARSCSVRRSAGLRKKSARTVNKRSRPPRAGARAGSAGPAPIGHSSAIIRRPYPISVNFGSTLARSAARAGRRRS